MKTAILTLLMVTTASGVAMAKNKTDVNSSSYAVEKLICSKAYVPATGVNSPTYQAGVDVNGNAVAPADMASSPVTIPDYIEVPMTIDLAKKMGMPPEGAEMQMPVANVKLYKDGRVDYNGQDMSSNVAAMCGGSSQQSMEPAAGQPVASPMPLQPQYIAPPEIRDDVTPPAGSVAASSTTPPPKIIYKLQQGTQARSSVTLPE